MGYEKKRCRLALAGLFSLNLLFLMANVCIGSVDIPLREVCSIVRG